MDLPDFTTQSAVVYKANIDYWMSETARSSIPFGVLAPHHNLFIENNTTNPNFQVDITADALLLSDSSGISYRTNDVNLTVDITASGANGLDTGSEANSTWYHLWSIYNPVTISTEIADGTAANKLIDSGADFSGDGVKVGDTVRNITDNTRTVVTAVDSGIQLSLADDIFVSGEGYEIYAVAGLLSLSATAPTIPSGYTYKGYVGAIYNSSGGNLVSIVQKNTRVVFPALAVLTTGGAATYTSVSLSGAVPTTAMVASGRIKQNKGSNPNTGLGNMAATSAGLGEIPLIYSASTSVNRNIETPFSIMLAEAQVVYYKRGTGDFSISISGWEY